MKLKKILRTNKAQSVIEYIVLLAVMAVSILAVFSSFNPDSISLRTVFNDAVGGAINNINNW